MLTWWLPVDKKRQQVTQAPAKTDENIKHVVSMQTQGVPNSHFQGLSGYTPHTPPSGTLSGTNEATRAPTHENPQSWHKRCRPRENMEEVGPTGDPLVKCDVI